MGATVTTHAIRDQAVRSLECDIPEGMTLAQYRAERALRAAPRRRRVPRLRRR
jgi:hypothetical protein